MIDSEDIETFDDGYYSDLSETDKEDFEELFETKLNNTSEQSIKRRLKSTYDEDIEHFELIQAACGCFHPGGGAANVQTDFEFIGTNPLADLKKTPADVALVKEEYDRITIEIICCEIGGETRGKWVENVNTVHNFLNEPEIRSQLEQELDVGDRELAVGYVTLAREEDTTGLEYPALEAECNASPYAIWESDSEDRCIRQIAGQLNHPDLTAVFEGDIDYLQRDQSLYVAMNSHPILGLEEIIFQLVKQNDTFGREEIDEFDRDDFRGHYERLFAVFCNRSSRELLIEGEVDRHIRNAKQSQILTTDSERRNTDRDYRTVYSGTRGPEYAREAVESRYLDNMPSYVKGKEAYFDAKEDFNATADISDFS